MRLRLLAAVIDAAVALGGMAALLGMGVVGARRYGGGKRSGKHKPRARRPMIAERLQSRPLRAALWGASVGLDVVGRNGRGPGFRVVGLRRVDAQTGGVVGVHSALRGAWVDLASRSATRPLFRSRAERARERSRELMRQARAVQHQHAGDRQAAQQAVMNLYKANNINPSASCGWALAGPLLSQLIMALAPGGGRTVRDRITGTCVIVDR